MKKILILATICTLLLSASNAFSKQKRRGGGLGVQLGPIAFGLGGSHRGPILGIGPSPNPDVPLSAVVIPGDDCDCNDDDYKKKDSRKNNPRSKKRHNNK